MHCAGQDRAADDDRVTGGFIFERFADQFTDAPDVGQVEIAVGLAGGSDADEGQLRLQDRFVLIIASRGAGPI